MSKWQQHVREGSLVMITRQRHLCQGQGRQALRYVQWNGSPEMFGAAQIAIVSASADVLAAAETCDSCTRRKASGYACRCSCTELTFLSRFDPLTPKHRCGIGWVGDRCSGGAGGHFQRSVPQVRGTGLGCLWHPAHRPVTTVGRNMCGHGPGS